MARQTLISRRLRSNSQMSPFRSCRFPVPFLFRYRLSAILTCLIVVVSFGTTLRAGLVSGLSGKAVPPEILALEKAARNGTAEAALKLGTILADAGNVAGEKWLKQALAAGEDSARTALGRLMLLTSSQGAEVDRATEGLRLLREAAESDAEANLVLGLLYARGQFVPADFKLAERYFAAAAGMEDAAGLFRLGWLHSGEAGFLGDAMPEKAVEYLEAGFERQNIEAGHLLVKLLNEGTRVPQDEARAFQIVARAASQGNANASLFLADLYEKGTGTVADPKKAFEAVQTAAELGAAEAQNRLGMIYLTGNEVVPVDLVGARQWFEKAAAQEHPAARFNLALILSKGAGPGSNEARLAVEYLISAAGAGLTVAQDRLGSWYRDGQYVAQDRHAALGWFREASDAGSISAKINLAQLLGMTPNRPGLYDTVVSLYAEAAAAGHPVAHYQLARLTASGILGKVDLVTAYAYLATAAEAGLPEAVKELPDLQSQLTSEQLKESESLQKNLKANRRWLSSG